MLSAALSGERSARGIGRRKTREKGLKQGGREAHQAMNIFVEHGILRFTQQIENQVSEKRAEQIGF
jgi:hypothetical protein